MKKIASLLALVFTQVSIAQDSQSPFVSFDDYEKLMMEVKEHRKTRLVSLDQFNEMSAQKDVYILDTRSKEMYDRKHVKGAIHLNFSDFTQANLDALFPNRNAIILIYCNNNFINDLDVFNPISDENFATKVSRPILDLSSIQFIEIQDSEQIQSQSSTEQSSEVAELTIQKPITLALNIPTYINLFGYGYKNVYELSELVSIFDSRIQFEGTEVIPTHN